jgi:hypothetical protein
MSFSYPGVPSNVDLTSAPFTITEPTDGDAANAASVNTPLSRLADLGETTRAALSLETAPTNFTQIMRAKVNTASGYYARLYAVESGGYAITVNAKWNGTVWAPDVGTAASSMLRIDWTGFQSYVHAAAGTWASWSGSEQLAVTGTGDLEVTHNLTVDNQLDVVGNGHFEADLQVDGDHTVTGDAAARNLVADVDLKGAAVVGTSTATFGNFEGSLTSTGGAGSSMAGKISFTVPGGFSGGGSDTLMCDVTFQASPAPYATAPYVVLQAASSAASGGNLGKLYVVPSATKFQIFVPAGVAIGAGAYVIDYIVIG